MSMYYAQICFTLESELHIGAGRAGMLAKTHSFVPGHIVSNALAVAIGKVQGGQYANFQTALQQVQMHTRCGPLFLQNPSDHTQVLLPSRDKSAIEQQFLTASNHVALHPDTRSSIEGALFEVEAIATRVLRGKHQGQPTQLIGGLWYDPAMLDGRELSDWLNACLLGGELKSGLGRVRVTQFTTDIYQYAGLGKVDAQGLHLEAGACLPGVGLNGIGATPFYPWVGRLFDKNKGFGRTLSVAAFVAYDATVTRNACFLPQNDTFGWGCWQRVD